MKKIIALILVLTAIFPLASCGAEKPDGESKESEKMTDEMTDKPKKDTASADTGDEETAEEPNDSLAEIFASVPVIGVAYATENNGDSILAIEAESFISSKPSVATIEKADDGNVIKAGESGVALIAYMENGEWKAVALCVIADLDVLDRSSSFDAQTFEKGGTFMLTSPVPGAEYISSDETVADVSAAPQISFNECGYACITLASASRPFSYSFVVYDRTVE